MSAALLLLDFLALGQASYPRLVSLFTQLDARLPHGDYRIPSLVASPNGTLLAFISGRMHRTDTTPNIIYLRRSLDDGNTWDDAVPILSDPKNNTEYGGAPIVDPSTGAITYVHNQVVFGAHGCGGCLLWGTTSYDEGATWSPAAPLNTTGPPNSTWGGPLASGITLKKGLHAGRMLVALRHDCGCGDLRSSFVVYSDDHGKTWQGGAQLNLLPQYGGGWTECGDHGAYQPTPQRFPSCFTLPPPHHLTPLTPQPPLTPHPSPLALPPHSSLLNALGH